MKRCVSADVARFVVFRGEKKKFGRHASKRAGHCSRVKLSRWMREKPARAHAK